MYCGIRAAAAVKRRHRHRTNNSFSTKIYGDRIKIRYTLMNLPQYNRLGAIIQAAILLIVITNISVVVVAQEEIISTTSSPTPKITNNNEDQSISPISPSSRTLAPFLPVTPSPIVSEAPMTASPTISPSLPPAPLVSFIDWLFLFIL